jgi:hypothetical protein
MRPPPSAPRHDLIAIGENTDTADAVAHSGPSEKSTPASLEVASAVAAIELNPIEWALAAKVKAASEATVAAKAEKAAFAQSASLSAAAAKAMAALRKAKSALSAAQAAVAKAHRTLAEAKTTDARAIADDEHSAAAGRLAAADMAVENTRVLELSRASDASFAIGAAKEAREARAAAQADVREAEQRLNPISVFVSKKAGRIYVRQGFKPVFDAPVAIRNPELAIGTHIFVATEARRDKNALRWMAISVPERPSTGSDRVRSDKANSRSNREQKVASQTPASAYDETAAGALDRIEIPDEAMIHISERLWSGASLIVSDHGLSHETGAATDFIVLTR